MYSYIYILCVSLICLDRLGLCVLETVCGVSPTEAFSGIPGRECSVVNFARFDSFEHCLVNSGDGRAGEWSVWFFLGVVVLQNYLGLRLSALRALGHALRVVTEGANEARFLLAHLIPYHSFAFVSCCTTGRCYHFCHAGNCFRCTSPCSMQVLATHCNNSGSSGLNDM